ncbi:unnamed protein product [Aphanomyces euteiches]|uniref:Ribosomal protein L22 n=1 Tax=Aphanomyces euteiches TaxID=100861 RepID=A0A6G0X9R4_9STRA|nr:hypothetical protein Ae201684_007002 [Aphanomyces euteiches]KAH9104215.1 hypothetical protein LEN26_015092 [Aphanomyces euteiches]KAH9106645.1 hypothetical protein AeMF1_017785 [Aphanomyces euteiches]KAH9133388.1 hypothetical protein AeRB84_020523 [Aphanomyces euteiches]KAH9196025.1 hypothetical protein AeNC1_002009 [Aphanomyces euteiches]
MLSRFCLARSLAAMSLTTPPVKPALPVMGQSFASRFLSTEAAEEIALPSIDEPAEFRSVQTMKKEIRTSPRKLTLLAQQIRGLTATEALTQMQFSPKRKAAVVKKTIQNAVNLADIYYGIEPSALKVEQAFVNKGMILKRIKFMGRGNTGIKRRRHSHLTIVLREFDPASEPISKTKARKLALKAEKEKPPVEESS